MSCWSAPKMRRCWACEDDALPRSGVCFSVSIWKREMQFAGGERYSKLLFVVQRREFRVNGF